MSCLDLEKLYLYLEGELDAAEARAVGAHLASCPTCRAAAEERELLLRAAGTLPALEVPSGFTQMIMERISPAPARERVRASRLGRLAAAAAVLAVTLGLAAFLAGLAPTHAFLNLSHFTWNSLRSFVTVAAKFSKFVILGFKILPQIAGEFLQTLKALTSVISPEVQIACASALLVILILAGFLWNRLLSLERHHEN
jgi:hypothetical protein